MPLLPLVARTRVYTPWASQEGQMYLSHTPSRFLLYLFFHPPLTLLHHLYSPLLLHHHFRPPLLLLHHLHLSLILQLSLVVTVLDLEVCSRKPGMCPRVDPMLRSDMISHMLYHRGGKQFLLKELSHTVHILGRNLKKVEAKNQLSDHANLFPA